MLKGAQITSHACYSKVEKGLAGSRAQSHTGETQKSPRPRIEPATFLLGGDGANKLHRRFVREETFFGETINHNFLQIKDTTRH